MPVGGGNTSFRWRREERRERKLSLSAVPRTVQLLKSCAMASVPPPPPPATLFGKLPSRPRVRSPPSPQHAAIPIFPEIPPVQETAGSSQTLGDHSEDASTPPMQNGSQFPPSQDGTGHEPSDGHEEKKHLPVQETDPSPQALGQQTSESRVPGEANVQTGENGEEHLL